MAYESTNWQTGDIVTADKLNNMEVGIGEISETIEQEIKPAFEEMANTIQDIQEHGTGGGSVNIVQMLPNNSVTQSAEEIAAQIEAGNPSYLKIPLDTTQTTSRGGLLPISIFTYSLPGKGDSPINSTFAYVIDVENPITPLNYRIISWQPAGKVKITTYPFYVGQQIVSGDTPKGDTQ